MIHIISWERFCEKDNLDDLEKYCQFLMERYPGLLDIRNLNIKQIGPSLSELPEDCLHVLIQKSSLLIEHRNATDPISGVDVIFKLFCLIARNNKNLDKISEKNTVDIVINYIDLSMTELTKELDTEWLNLFEYLLYFLEIIYDPTFSWRRRKKLYFSETAVLDDNNDNYKVTKITNDIVTWLCCQLNAFSGERDISNRLLHLLCSILSGSLTNSQLLITPAIVDTFTFQTDVSADAVASFCLLISCLSRIPTLQRQEDLSVVVTKLLIFLREKPELRIHELRCLRLLLDVNAELSEEFIIGDIFSVFERCVCDKDADKELYRLSFMIMSKLTVGASVAKEQFLLSKGYDKVLDILSRSQVQAKVLLDLMFSWAVCSEFDGSKISTDQYVIRDGHVVGMLVGWAMRQAMSVKEGVAGDEWKSVFMNLSVICHKSRRSTSQCCHSGVVTVICQCITATCALMDRGSPHEDETVSNGASRVCSDLINDLFDFLEILTDYSISGPDLVAIFGIFKDKHARTRGRRVIKMLNRIVLEFHRNQDVSCWFELSEPEDCILIAPINNSVASAPSETMTDFPTDKELPSVKILESLAGKVNASNFSFHCWINLSPVSVIEKVDSGHERSCIFRLLTETWNGFEVFLNMDGQLFVATCHQGEFQYVQVNPKNPVKKSQFSIEESILKPGKWHMIDLVFQNSRTYFGRSTVTVYIDGQNINVLDLKYPQINEKISVFHIGGCPKSVSNEIINTFNVKNRRKSGFLSGTSPRRTWLGEEHNLWGRLSGPKCRLATVACINDALMEPFIAGLYTNGPMNSNAIHVDEVLANNILINYHALVYDPRDTSCPNLHPYIQSSKNNKFHCGYLKGERLTALKLQVAINEIGGVATLLPIIEQLDTMELAQDDEHRSDTPSINNNEDGKLGDSILANIVILLSKMSLFNINQKQMERSKSIEIIGCFLQKINTMFLDMNVLIAFHTMADQCDQKIKDSIYQWILLDWRIWSRCSIDTRYSHCAFISNVVKNERQFFRKQYGVSFFLEVLRLYHRPSLCDGSDVTKRLRHEIYDVIYFLVHKHAVILDYQRMVKFLHESSEDSTIQEILELLTRLYNSCGKSDQDCLLLYESKLMESLFVVLIRDLSIDTKEATIAFLHMIITSDRVMDKHKDHLLLTDISFASIFIYKEFYESPLSSHSIQQLLGILRKAASKDLFGVIQFLSLLTLSPMEQRIDAMRMLKSFFDKSPDAIFTISQQPGWQDILIHLLVAKKRGESDTNNNEGVKAESVSLRNRDVNSNAVGFRRSSTWAFDESINLNNGFQKTNFDEILEEEEDYSTNSDILDTTTDESQEVKSTETLFLHRRSLGSGDSVMYQDDNDLSLSMSTLRGHTFLGSFSGSEEIPTWAKNADVSLDCSGKEMMDQNTPEEELLYLVLECLHRVMWSVLNTSNDESAWMTVHQVMESLRSVNERYFMLKPMFYIKERILIGLLNSTINLFRVNDTYSQINLMHANELIRLIVDSSCVICADSDYQYETELLDLTVVLFQDCLKVWDEHSMYPELSALGFHYLLTMSCSSDPDIVSAVCARLHHIISLLSKNIIYDEISFIVVQLDKILKKVIDSDNYFFIAPILKTLLECHHDMLQVSMYLKNISIKTPDFYEYFKDYCTQSEWKTFVKSRLFSACEIYESSYLNGVTTSQSLWRAEANEQTSLDRKKRRAISIDHKQLFEAEIINLTLSWIKEEKRKRDYRVLELKKQHENIDRHWGTVRQFLTSAKGCWKEEGGAVTMPMKQSRRENYLRMRPRFDINYQFDRHADASNERDHPCRSPREVETSDTMQRLSSLERKFNFTELGDDQLGDDEWISIQNIEQADVNNNSTPGSPSQSAANKKSVFECPCRMVTLVEVVDGKFEVTSTHFKFQRNSAQADSSDSNNSKILCLINQIREVHLRRYNLQRSAIEIFLTDQTNYFFNFDAKIRDKVYSKIVSQRPPNLIYSKARSPADLLKSSNLTQRWVNREISNFEYLMQLNTIAGRTYNDMSQYPVFPWVISDYTSPKLDLDNPKTFRDLSKPIGVVNPKHEADVREKYDSFEDPTGVVSKFHYGTHYSVSAGVMHYLVRMEPFTTMHIHLQSGKFDTADRQFHSIPLSWSIIMDSPNDNKELIPEFFYQPQFLKNENDFDFGHLQQTKTKIDDVELPAWASSPEDFIYQHRNALESEHVSANLHHWIDLIFGYKQKGIDAVKSLNVFYYATYEGVIDFDKISDPYERESLESMINNFGQTPCQLLKHPHPRRMSADELRNQMIKVDKYLPVMAYTGYLKHSSKQISTATDPITFVRVPFAQTRTLMGPDRSLSMVTVHASNIVARHNWIPNTKGAGSPYSIEVDLVFDSPNSRRKSYLGTLNSVVNSNNQLYAVTPDCKFVLAGGHVESRLSIMSLKKQEVHLPATPHHGSISCLSIDIDSIHPNHTGLPSSTVTTQLFGISGSVDSTCAIWDWSDLPKARVVQVLYGHSVRVVSVSLSMYLDVAVSGSVDGTVIVHSITKGEFLHCIVPGGLNSAMHLSVNFVLLNRLGHVYVQWQNGVSVKKQSAAQQYISLYSLRGDHISTNDIGCNRMTVATVVPRSLGSIDVCVLVGNDCGQLLILDGYDLTEINILQFQGSILDACLLSLQGQYLCVALSGGQLVLSAVNLETVDN